MFRKRRRQSKTCPPHSWTQWKYEDVEGFKLDLRRGNKYPCAIRYQWRVCEICGYREEEPL